MADNQKCPLCGNEIKENESFCQDCRNIADNSYPIELISTDVSVEKKENVAPIVTKSVKTSSADFYQTDNDTPYLTHNSNKKAFVFIIVGLILIVLVGGVGSYVFVQNKNAVETEIAYWEKCVEENTRLGYSKYLVQYPDGKFSEQAYNKIDELHGIEQKEWDMLRSSNDIDALFAYLKDHPETPYIEDVRRVADSLGWLKTAKENTADAYKAYLDNVKLGHFVGGYKDSAQVKFDYLSQLKAVEGEDLISVKKVLSDFFKSLSTVKYNDVQKMMTPVFAKYYDSENIPAAAVIDLMKSNIKKSNANRISYTPIVDSIEIIRDNKGIYFITLPVKTETTYLYKKKEKAEKKQKKGKSKKSKQKEVWLERKERSEYSVNIELNDEKLLKALYKKDK